MKGQYIPDVCDNCKQLYKLYHDEEWGCKLSLFRTQSFDVAIATGAHCRTKKHNEAMEKFRDGIIQNVSQKLE